MGSCQPRHSPMCPEAKVQVLRRTGVLSVLTWPHIFLSLTIRPEEAGGSCQNGRGPKSSESFTACPEEARDFCQCGFGIHIFLRPHQSLTRLGSSVCMEASPYFPKSTPGVLRTSASCCVGMATCPPITSLQVLRRPGLLTPWMRPSPSRSLNLCPERPGSSCQSGHGTTAS